MRMSMQWSSGPVALGQRFGQLSGRALDIAVAGLEQIAQQSRDQLERLTPGSKLPKGWKVLRRGGKTFRSRIIENKDPRAYELISYGQGKTTNLIEILEFGTSHTKPIVPVNAKVLAFPDPQTGRTVFTTRVNHPGTQAYAMVRITTEDATRKMAKLTTAVARQLRIQGSR